MEDKKIVSVGLNESSIYTAATEGHQIKLIAEIITPATTGALHSFSKLGGCSYKEPGAFNHTHELGTRMYSDKEFRNHLYIALANQPHDLVNQLIVGLPSYDLQNTSIRDALSDYCCGVHQLSSDRQVEVKNTVTLPSPLGAFYSFINDRATYAELKVISEGKVCVVEMHGSNVDLVSMERGAFNEMEFSSSFNSIEKMMNFFAKYSPDLLIIAGGSFLNFDLLAKQFMGTRLVAMPSSSCVEGLCIKGGYDYDS